jgi:hypothetical protein
MFDRLRNRRLGTVLFDPLDEYFIPAAKATDLAALRLSRLIPIDGDANCEKSPN